MAQENAVETLRRARYAGLDFATHLDDLQSRMQVQFAAEFNDFVVSSLGIMLLDTIAYGLDTLSFYLDRRASDAYLATARTRRSIARLCRQLGYKMGAAVGSSVDLMVSLEDANVLNVPIPAGFQFQGPAGAVFEAAETVIIPAGSTDQYLVPCYQGESQSESFVSDGTAHQVFELAKVADGSFVTGGTVVIICDGSQWVEKEFLEYGDTAQFECGYNDDPATIRFGDGILGRIPPAGSSVNAYYVISKGKEGQASSHTITSAVNPLVVGLAEVALIIDNPQGSVGGDDLEDIEHARAYAPKVWKSRQVAVTREDYEALAGAYAHPLFGRVAVTQAISARSADADLALRSLITQINSYADDPVPVVQAGVASLNASLALLQASCGDIEATLLAMAAGMGVVDAQAGTLSNSLRSIVHDSSDASAFVMAVPVAGASTLTAADQALLNGLVTGMGSTASAAAASVGVIADQADVIGTDLTTAGTLLYDADQLRQGMEAVIGIPATPAGMYIQTAAILDIVEDTSDEIAALGQAIFDHVDKFLSADCKANLVVVPVLCRDAAGFYAPPGTGLLKALESYLEQRKEVTHTLEVISGEDFMVPAVVQAEIAVLPGYPQSVAEASAVATIEALLKGRKFGQSLMLSVLKDALMNIEAVGWTNASISGSWEVPLATPPVLDTTRLDAYGNLILSLGDILTRGQVTVTSRALTTAGTQLFVEKEST